MTWEKYYKKNKILPNIDLGDHNLRILYKHRKSFYNSIGFEIIGDRFDISGIGPHNYMYKKIY